MGTLFLALICVMPQERGLVDWGPIEEVEIVGDVTDKVIIGTIPRPAKNKLISVKENSKASWVPVDSCSFSGRIPNQGRYYVKVDSGKLYPFTPDSITTTATEVVETAPEWLKIPLWNNFSRMDLALQDVYANVILSNSPYYRDELGFIVARLDPLVLQYHASNPTIFVDNVKLIYQYDTLLDYVRLVEYGDYTTAKYKVANNGSDTIEIEIPKEIYYWYVVHPVLSAEAPRYIDPTSSTGPAYFWRDYLFNYPDTAERIVWNCYGPPDTIYPGFVSPILKEELADEQILYNGKIDAISDNGAVAIVSKWINDVMVFNSFSGDAWGGERSGQPVRIYHMHRGRCGEHADIVAAAARTALIPARSPYDVTRDHTWNEWYDTEWRGWEPFGSYLNSTHHYEGDNPTWEFRDVFAWRGDGYTYDVTDRYSQHCTLTVIVKDVADLPVDGARVGLYSELFDDSTYIWESNRKFTDSDGFAEFILADSVNFYVAVVGGGLRGSYPSGGKVVRVISCATPGQHYNWTCNLPGHQSSIPVSEDILYDTTRFYKIEAKFNVSQEIIHGQSRYYNDLPISNCCPRYGRFVDVAKNIEFFVCDTTNFKAYESGSAFKALSIGHDVDSGDVSFIGPDNQWCAVFSAKDLFVNGEVVDINLKLYEYDPAVEENSKQIRAYLNVSPTPFKSFASIEFMVPQKENATLGIYDLSGRCVKKIISNAVVTGKQRFKLSGKEIGSGVYFVRLVTDKRTMTKKIMLVR